MTDLTPITRLEYDLDGIVNNHSLLDPITRVEMYLSDIAAGRTASLSPITRIEMYLAKISGASVEVPAPITRIEMYLAAIAGEDVETPDPITRVEYWLDQWAEQSGSGVITTVTGTSPLALANALDKSIRKLIQYGKVTTSNGEMYCNNGKLVAVGDELSVVGTPEVLTVGEQTATVENLLAVDDIKDEQNIISGAVTRRCEAVVSDGTTPSGRYIGEVGDGNIIVKVRETGYEGDVATFEADRAKPLNGLTVNVEPIQDLHGYDNPWPAGGSRNKLKPRTLDELKALNTVGTWSGNTYTHNGISYAWNIFNGYADTVTISGTATAFSRCNIYMTADLTEYSDMVANCGVAFTNGLGLTIQGSNSPWTTYGSSSGTDRTISTIDPVPCNMFLSIQANTAFSAPLLIKPMIRPASESDSTFIHYSNICPISGRTSATVTRTGKNLLENVGVSGSSNGITWNINSDGSISLSGTATSRVYINLSRGSIVKQYPIARGPASITSSANTISISGINFQTDIYVNGVYKRTLQRGNQTVDFSDGIISIGISRLSISQDTVIPDGTTVYPQLELGSTASSYDPYAGDTYTITLGDTVYGGTLDVTGGKMVVDRAIFTLDGTSKKFGYKFPDKEVYQHTLLTPAKAVSGMVLSKTVCDRLQTQPDNTVQAASADAISTNTTGAAIKVCLVSENLGSLASANDWLTSNPLQVCYELAQPIEITLTPTQIETLIGTNNIWSDAGSVKAYVADGDVIEHVTAQPLRTAEGSNTVAVTSEVDPVQLSATYTASA